LFLSFVVGFKTAAGLLAGGTAGKSHYLKNVLHQEKQQTKTLRITRRCRVKGATTNKSVFLSLIYNFL
jgi:hypothetical protein